MADTGGKCGGIALQGGPGQADSGSEISPTDDATTIIGGSQGRNLQRSLLWPKGKIYLNEMFFGL